jgi:hypothetical protein
MTRFKWCGVAAIALAMLLGNELAPVAPFASFVTDAQAVIGHPATPGSVAGATRRTTRRVIRRSTTYVAVLPKGCVRTTVGSVALWRCGPTYYQPYHGSYVVVYVN